MPDFNNILDTNFDDVKAPKPLPQGDFTFRIKRYEYIESSQKGTPGVLFEVQPTSAGEDVDEELLAQVENWQDKTLRTRLWLTENSAFMLKQFLQAAGVEVEGKSIKEAVPEAVGAEFIGRVTQQELDDGRVVNPDVDRPRPIE